MQAAHLAQLFNVLFLQMLYILEHRKATLDKDEMYVIFAWCNFAMYRTGKYMLPYFTLQTWKHLKRL